MLARVIATAQPPPLRKCWRTSARFAQRELLSKTNASHVKNQGLAKKGGRLSSLPPELASILIGVFADATQACKGARSFAQFQ